MKDEAGLPQARKDGTRKMKQHRMQILSGLLSLMLLLGVMMPAALAESGTVQLMGEVRGYQHDHVVIGDTLYFLLDNYSGEASLCLYSWTKGQEQATCLAEGLPQLSVDVDFPAEELDKLRQDGMEVDHVIHYMFTDGERLLGLNYVTGLIFEIVPGESGLTYQDVVTMDSTSVFVRMESDYSYLKMPSAAVATDGMALFLISDYDADYNEFYHLIRVDLSSGKTEESKAQNVRMLLPYKDGKVLLLQRTKENYYDMQNDRYLAFDVSEYDVASDTVTVVSQLDNNLYSMDAQWSDALQAIVWTNNGRIMALADGLKTQKQVGYVPLNYVSKSVVMGDTLLCVYDSEVYVRNMSMDFNAEEYLTLYGTGGMNAKLLFSSRYPDVPIYTADEYYASLDTLAQAMVTGSDSLDVLGMSISYSQFTTMLRKGYCADLSSSSVITDAVQRMYPVFQEAVKNKNGAICAVPVSAYSSGWYVNRYVMEEVGLTEEDLPTNYVELCEFVTRWNNEFADEYDMYTVFSTSGADYLKGNLFNYVLRDYIDYCEATTGSIRFDTDIFREMIAAIDAVECRDIRPSYEKVSAEDGIWRDSLFDYGMSIISNFYIANDDQYSIPMMLSLTADTEVINTANVDVIFINPRSKHFDTALRYVECVLESIENTEAAYVLYTDKTEPLENSYYEQNIKDMENSIAELEAEMAAADESDKRSYQEMIDGQKEWLEEYKANYRYDVSPEAITWYQTKIVPTMAVGKQTFLNASNEESATAELNTLIKRYKDGQINIDQFIKEADRKLYMMEMEDQ